MVSICGKVPIQEAPNGLPCAVSDARFRMLGCMDPVDYDQFHLHFFIFNFMFIFDSMPVFPPEISFLNNEARMLTGP